MEDRKIRHQCLHYDSDNSRIESFEIILDTFEIDIFIPALHTSGSNFYDDLV